MVRLTRLHSRHAGACHQGNAGAAGRDKEASGVANLFNDEGRDRAHRTRRSIGRVLAVGVAIAAAGSVSLATVSAHRIVSTTPNSFSWCRREHCALGHGDRVCGQQPARRVLALGAEHLRHRGSNSCLHGQRGGHKLGAHRQHGDLRLLRAQSTRASTSGLPRSSSTPTGPSRTARPPAPMSR